MLKISSEFRKRNIPHVIQKPSSYRWIKGWIGFILSDIKEDLISFEDFSKRYKLIDRNITNEEIEKGWEVLKHIEGRKSSRLKVSDFFSNITNSTKVDNNIYVSADSDSNIVISTIHRAKGREYDSVVIDQNLGNFCNSIEINDLLNELKICYVALTRAKSDVKKIECHQALLKNDINDRWREEGVRKNKNKFIKNKKKRLSLIEVGKEEDIEYKGFVDMKLFKSKEGIIENQEYIKDNIGVGDELVLVRSEHDGGVIYKIVHKLRTIGLMSEKFTFDLFCILKKMNLIREQADYNYYPLEIQEVYVDDIITCFEYNNENSKFDVWNGITISGFGKIYRGDYY